MPTGVLFIGKNVGRAAILPGAARDGFTEPSSG